MTQPDSNGLKLSPELLAQLKTVKMPQPIRAIWDPQPDITAYELAMLLPIYLGMRPLLEDEWITLGTMQRHLKRVDQPQITT